MANEVGLGKGALLNELRKALRQQDPLGVNEIALNYVSQNFGAKGLAQPFIAAGKTDLFVRFLLENRESCLIQFSYICAFLRSCFGVGASEARIRELRGWLQSPSAPEVQFHHLDFINWMNFTEPKAIATAIAIKYSRRSINPTSAASALIDELSKSCIASENVTSFLYENRRHREITRDRWLNVFKSAQAYQHLLVDAPYVKKVISQACSDDAAILDRVDRLANDIIVIDKAECLRVFNQIDRQGATLLCRMHGNYAFLLNKMGSQYLKKFQPLTQGEIDRTSGSATIFRYTKYLLSGTHVMIAPDGPHFEKQSGVELIVFGRPTTVSQGAALMAYEAGCATAWCTVIRKNGMFTPVFLPGPQKSNGEKFSSFLDRWLRFYAERIEQAFTSFPDELVLSSARWTQHFEHRT